MYFNQTLFIRSFIHWLDIQKLLALKEDFQLLEHYPQLGPVEGYQSYQGIARLPAINASMAFPVEVVIRRHKDSRYTNETNTPDDTRMAMPAPKYIACSLMGNISQTKYRPYEVLISTRIIMLLYLKFGRGYSASRVPEITERCASISKACRRMWLAAQYDQQQKRAVGKNQCYHINSLWDDINSVCQAEGSLSAIAQRWKWKCSNKQGEYWWRRSNYGPTDH